MSAENSTKTIDPKLDLEKIKRECEAMIKSKAKMSAVAAIVPVPLLDVAVDATLLSKLLPEISAKFGLIEPAQAAVDLNNGTQINQLKDKAVDLAKLVVTRSIAKKAFQGFGSRIIAKQVTKFIPFGGQLVSGTIGYLMFKKIAENHINECYQKAKKLQQQAS